MIADYYISSPGRADHTDIAPLFPAGTQAVAESLNIISAWPGYKFTSLLNLSGAAKHIGVAEVYYKQEAERFGLNSFKALGGAYAVCRVLMQAIASKTGAFPPVSDILEGKYKNITEQIVVCCATDGNHGRSVAWGAQKLGCRSVIYIHETVSENRGKAIAAFGAEVIRTKGNYDDAVRYAGQQAEQNGWTIVSDTSYEGYTEIPGWIMQGYGVIAAETIEQLNGIRPTHVFLQAGVGGFAAAILSYMADYYGAEAPHVIITEPSEAACILKSARAGHYESITGELDTIMAGLACGEPSGIALPELLAGSSAFVAITDESVKEAMRGLARGYNDDAPVTAGESGIAGFATLLTIMTEQSEAAEKLRQALTLGPDSRVLLIGTEGDTDPDLYRHIISGADHG